MESRNSTLLLLLLDFRQRGDPFLQRHRRLWITGAVEGGIEVWLWGTAAEGAGAAVLLALRIVPEEALVYPCVPA